jgi:hypothetical protein
MVSWKIPPSSYAASSSRRKMSSTSAGGVYGLSDWKRCIMKYTASSRTHSTGSSMTPVGSPSSRSS